MKKPEMIHRTLPVNEHTASVVFEEIIYHGTFCGLIHFFSAVYYTSLHSLFIAPAFAFNIWL